MKTKIELTKQIGKAKIPLKLFKYSYLYLLSLELLNDEGTPYQQYFKFGKTQDPAKRFKQFEKDYMNFKIGYFWLSYDMPHCWRWLDMETQIIESKIKKTLDANFEKWDKEKGRIYGWTEIYKLNNTLELKGIKTFVTTEIKMLMGQNNISNLEDLKLCTK
ncbi:MAG: hypothetical protein ACO3IM_05690 [Pelagibacteraceae bacterium]|jgi:hypothetical protein